MRTWEPLDAKVGLAGSQSDTLLRSNGRRGCKETAYTESLRVARQKPVDTQWQNHLYMAEPRVR